MRPGPSYVWWVGAAFAVLVVVAVLNGLRTEQGGTLGIDPRPGEPVPAFALPDARSSLEGDANVSQGECPPGESCPRDPEWACGIEVAGAIRICDLFDRPLVVSFWFTRAGGCEAQQDTVDRVWRSRRDEVNFLSINIRDDRDRVREAIGERGWELPVGHDRDGAVANLLRVGGCPAFLFVEEGGRVAEEAIGAMDAGELERRVERLVGEGGAAP